MTNFVCSFRRSGSIEDRPQQATFDGAFADAVFVAKSAMDGTEVVILERDRRVGPGIGGGIERWSGVVQDGTLVKNVFE